MTGQPAEAISDRDVAMRSDGVGSGTGAPSISKESCRTLTSTEDFGQNGRHATQTVHRGRTGEETNDLPSLRTRCKVADPRGVPMQDFVRL